MSSSVPQRNVWSDLSAEDMEQLNIIEDMNCSSGAILPSEGLLCELDGDDDDDDDEDAESEDSPDEEEIPQSRVTGNGDGHGGRGRKRKAHVAQVASPQHQAKHDQRRQKNREAAKRLRDKGTKRQIEIREELLRLQANQVKLRVDVKNMGRELLDLVKIAEKHKLLCSSFNFQQHIQLSSTLHTIQDMSSFVKDMDEVQAHGASVTFTSANQRPGFPGLKYLPSTRVDMPSESCTQKRPKNTINLEPRGVERLTGPPFASICTSQISASLVNGSQTGMVNLANTKRDQSVVERIKPPITEAQAARKMTDVQRHIIMSQAPTSTTYVERILAVIPNSTPQQSSDPSCSKLQKDFQLSSANTHSATDKNNSPTTRKDTNISSKRNRDSNDQTTTMSSCRSGSNENILVSILKQAKSRSSNSPKVAVSQTSDAWQFPGSISQSAATSSGIAPAQSCTSNVRPAATQSGPFGIEVTHSLTSQAWPVSGNAGKLQTASGLMLPWMTGMGRPAPYTAANQSRPSGNSIRQPPSHTITRPEQAEICRAEDVSGSYTITNNQLSASCHAQHLSSSHTITNAQQSLRGHIKHQRNSRTVVNPQLAVNRTTAKLGLNVTNPQRVVNGTNSNLGLSTSSQQIAVNGRNSQLVVNGTSQQQAASGRVVPGSNIASSPSPILPLAGDVGLPLSPSTVTNQPWSVSDSAVCLPTSHANTSLTLPSVSNVGHNLGSQSVTSQTYYNRPQYQKPEDPMLQNNCSSQLGSSNLLSHSSKSIPNWEALTDPSGLEKLDEDLAADQFPLSILETEYHGIDFLDLVDKPVIVEPLSAAGLPGAASTPRWEAPFWVEQANDIDPMADLKELIVTGMREANQTCM